VGRIKDLKMLPMATSIHELETFPNENYTCVPECTWSGKTASRDQTFMKKRNREGGLT
jgi:hypothetical protein